MLKLNTIFFVIALFVLAGIHIISLQLFLYWKFPWFDIPVHFLGGAVVALGVFTARDFFHLMPVRFLYVVPVLAAVLIVALLWELFEISIGIPVLEPGYQIDTIIDIVFGLFGGFLGFLVGHSLRRL